MACLWEWKKSLHECKNKKIDHLNIHTCFYHLCLQNCPLCIWFLQSKSDSRHITLESKKPQTIEFEE